MVSIDLKVPAAYRLGEDTMKVIERIRNDTIVFTAWVVDLLTFQFPEKLFVHFAYSGDTIPFTLVNNTKDDLKVRLSGYLVRGTGKVKFGTYPSALYWEEGIYPPFQDTLQIDLKSLQAKELVVFILAENRFDTVKICAEVEKLTGDGEPKLVEVIRPIERAMKKEESDLFYDDFSSGDMRNWRIISELNSWEVVDEVAKGDKDWHMAFAPLHLTPEWTDYKYQVNTKLNSSSNPLVDWIKSFIYFRVQNESTYYRFGMAQGFKVISLWKRVNSVWSFLANCDFNVKKDVWYNLRVEVIGDNIKCFLDGEQVINIRDSIEPLKEGGIGIGVTEDAYVNYYDDIVVRKIPTSPER